MGEEKQKGKKRRPELASSVSNKKNREKRSKTMP